MVAPFPVSTALLSGSHGQLWSLLFFLLILRPSLGNSWMECSDFINTPQEPKANMCETFSLSPEQRFQTSHELLKESYYSGRISGSRRVCTWEDKDRPARLPFCPLTALANSQQLSFPGPAEQKTTPPPPMPKQFFRVANAEHPI